MEEDKKKKKNKKKKNKQQKATENSVDGAGEHTTPGQNHVHETVQKSTGQVHEIADAQNDILPITDADQLRHVANGPEVSTLAEAEKHHWLEREASLEEKIKQLQEERNAHIQKEVILEEKIQQLLKEKDATLAKEASQGNLLEKIKKLHDEKVAYSLKEASLEHRISQLEKEKDAYAQKESSLEEEIALLQSEKKAHMQKEIQFEEKINHLMDEAANLSLEKVSLEEKAKQMEREIDSWVQKENSNKEVLAILSVDNSRLNAQVLQLEQSRNSLLEENQQLRETISGLQSQVLNFEETAALSHSSTEGKMQNIENGDVASQTEAALMLVEKLITENAELVEKVNELYVELNRRSLQKEMSSDDGTPGTAESAVVADNSAYLLDLKVGPDVAPTADLMQETGAKMFVSGENVQTGKVVIKDERNNEYMGATNTGVFSNSSETIDSDEIVQIPLDENERLLMDLEAGNNNAERTEVPISDAPLIGAPFRIMSFVARYVSGADLVESNTATARR